jgi:ribA/ribD-fused uncharacterized protein
MEQFTFFWKGPFSQWLIRDFIIDTVTYNCCEQYMMASKALLFKDTFTYNKIMSTTKPFEQKALGREVQNFDNAIWMQQAKKIVYNGNFAKFTQHDDLKKLLLETKGTTLVEASPKDSLWGIGLAETDDRAKDRKTWKGKNWLGETLTQVREDIAVLGTISTTTDDDTGFKGFTTTKIKRKVGNN